MDDRKRMIRLRQAGWSVSELAESFRVSRQTIYTWIERWDPDDPESLQDRSRRPHTSPTRTDRAIEAALLKAKEQHPDYGPYKIALLLELDYGIYVPESTTRDVLRRNGCVKARRARSPKWSPAVEPIIDVPGPGHSMSADFKGQFRLGNGRYCYPLTIADPGSRYVFAVESLPINSGALSIPAFERVFRRWGLPEQMITDNGAPFCASQSIGGISEFGRWLERLRVLHVRIQPGRPQQNGRHERMHQTLKAKTTRPPAHDGQAQQGVFDAFVHEYNHVRPHQAIGTRPAMLVERYRRDFPSRLPEIEYAESFVVRRVRSNGYIKWRGREVFVGEVLTGEPVALVQISDTSWQLYFGTRHLADWCDRSGQWVQPGKGRSERPPRVAARPARHNDKP